MDLTRQKVVDFAIDHNAPEELRTRDIYVFGVYKGHSIVAYLQFLNSKEISFRRIVGFDSFEGLPSEQEGVVSFPGYVKGLYSAKANLGMDSPTRTANLVKRALSEFIGGGKGDNVDFVVGYYQDTLVPELVLKLDLKPALFVEVDVDLYISTKQLLQFMSENNLIVDGTIICYDDWAATAEFEGGESKAHKEWVEKHGVVCEELYDTTRYYTNFHGQKIFRVRK